MDKLKPCPFCGSDGRIITDEPNCPHYRTTFYVICMNSMCECELRHSIDKELAITAWNTRADGWVSVKDRLPKGFVLLACRNSQLNYDVRIGYWDTDIQEFYDDGEGFILHPTHWQHLPPVPEEEK